MCDSKIKMCSLEIGSMSAQVEFNYDHAYRSPHFYYKPTLYTVSCWMFGRNFLESLIFAWDTKQNIQYGEML